LQRLTERSVRFAAEFQLDLAAAAERDLPAAEQTRELLHETLGTFRIPYRYPDHHRAPSKSQG